MADDLETLKNELARAKLEIEELNIRLSNAVLMLKKEMLASGRLPGLPPQPVPAKEPSD